MKSIGFKILLLLIVIFMSYCNSSKQSQTTANSYQIEANNDTLFYLYDTSSKYIFAYLDPVNYDEDFQYTNEVFFNLNKEKDTCLFTYYEDKSINKELYIDIKKSSITPVNFRNALLVAKGEYYLDKKIYFSKSRMYDNLGEELDTLVVEKHFKGFRNGKWIYYNQKGKLIKEETWKEGVLINPSKE